MERTATYILSETYGRRGRHAEYRVQDSGRGADFRVMVTTSSDKNTLRFKLIQLIKAIFLPHGYPDSVSKDYFNYQVWDTFQAFISTLMGTLSTQAVLTGIGVGDDSVTPIAATVTWLLRDGSSMLGRIIFAWKQGSSLDCDSKRWRLFADFVNDVAIGLDLLAAQLLAFSTIILCLSGVFRSLVGVAGSATRAAFVQHQARRSNLADVAAKDGSQETLVNLCGLIVSLVLLPYASNNTGLTWFLYLVFASLHLLCNYKAVRSIVMDSLNQTRLQILVDSFLDNPRQLPNVTETNLKETIIIGAKGNQVALGCRLDKTTQEFREFKALQSLYLGSKYLLNVDMETRKVYITLHTDSDSSTLFESSFQAHVLLNYIRNASDFEWKVRGQNVSKGWPDKDKMSSKKFDLLERSRKCVQGRLKSFLKILEADGWQIDHPLLGPEEWRATWKYEPF